MGDLKARMFLEIIWNSALNVLLGKNLVDRCLNEKFLIECKKVPLNSLSLSISMEHR